VLVGGLVAVRLPAALQAEVRQRIVSVVTSRCHGCTLSYGRATFGVFPFTVTLHDPHFTGGDPAATGVEARARRLLGVASLLDLASQRLTLRQIRLEELEVMVTEGDLRSPDSAADPNAVPSLWTVAIQKTMIVDAKFTYVRNSGTGKNSRHAVLHVNQIQAEVDELGTTPELKADIARARAQGQLENSGKFKLAIATPLFVPKLSVDIDLRISDQNLGDLNAFFTEDDGITFSGSLYQGHASVVVRERKLRASVEAKYLGLNIEFARTRDRSELEAWFSNVAKSLKLDASSIGEKAVDQKQAVEIQRLNRESLLKFIFRGLKDAALKVAAT